MDLLIVFKHGDAVLISVFIILILMSIWTWWIILMDGCVRRNRIKNSSAATIAAVAQAGNLDDVLRKAKAHPSVLSELTESAIAAANEYRANPNSPIRAIPLNEYMVQHIRNRLEQSKRQLSRGLGILASVGATAPFIGLLGTVWGIYRALANISQQGQVNIATVAGPIGEALVATAIGLFAAIPAVLAYNFILHRNKQITQLFDSYAYDLHVRIINSKEQ